MSRFSALARALLPLALLAGLATGCGNKGPLFLPPPAVHEPEGALPPAAPPPTTEATSTEATSTEATSTEAASTEAASSGEAGPQGPAEGN